MSASLASCSEESTPGKVSTSASSWELTGNASISGNEQNGTDTIKVSGNGNCTRIFTNLDNGLYDLSFKSISNGSQKALYVGANKRITSPQTSSIWKLGMVRGIEVVDGKVTVTLNSEGSSSAISRFTDIKLAKAVTKIPFIKGGDVSQLTYVEQKGGKYYENGVQDDCLKILSRNGMNLVRLRLYNDPGNPDYSPSNRLPKGIQTQEDILRLAKRAKAEGMQIMLTFYYSDYWDSDITHLWQGCTNEQLKDSVYHFTESFMKKMKDQGTEPEYVSVGNETNNGFLLPVGSIDNITNLASFYNAAYDAIKSVTPSSRVIIHISGAGNNNLFSWYFGLMDKYNVKYDIMGGSYYPYWNKIDAATAVNAVSGMTAKFDKDFIFMETGYAFRKDITDGSWGQLSNNGPYEDLSYQGQKNFILELSNLIKCDSRQRILGYVYWDPIFIPAGDAGWELGAKNVVSNSTLFDWKGNTLPVLEAFKYNN